MKKLILFSMLTILSGCSAKKKIIEREKQSEKIEVKKKVDSISVKKDKTEIQKHIMTETDDFNIKVFQNIKPKSDSIDKTKNQPMEKYKLSKIKITSPSGKIVDLEIPSGYDYDINSNTGKKTEFEKQNKQKSDSVSLKANIDKKVDKSESKRNVDSDRKEPAIFNKTIAIVIGVILLIIIAVVYFKYKSTKPF